MVVGLGHQRQQVARRAGGGFLRSDEQRDHFQRLRLALDGRDGGQLHLVAGDAQLGLARGDIQRQFVIEVQRAVIKQVQRLDVFQQPVLMAVQIGGDAVDLGLDLFVIGDEFGKGTL